MHQERTARVRNLIAELQHARDTITRTSDSAYVVRDCGARASATSQRLLRLGLSHSLEERLIPGDCRFQFLHDPREAFIGELAAFARLIECDHQIRKRPPELDNPFVRMVRQEAIVDGT
jgi:hypothetical protein